MYSIKRAKRARDFLTLAGIALCLGILLVSEKLSCDTLSRRQPLQTWRWTPLNGCEVRLQSGEWLPRDEINLYNFQQQFGSH